METGAGQSTRRLLPLRPLAKTYADRLLVVGDAGGFTKPTKAVRFRGLAAAFFLATLATVLAGVVGVRSRAKEYFTEAGERWRADVVDRVEPLVASRSSRIRPHSTSAARRPAGGRRDAARVLHAHDRLHPQGAAPESLNKEHTTAKAIIISEATYAAARDAIEARPLGEVTVKGKTRPVAIYELVGLKSG